MMNGARRTDGCAGAPPGSCQLPRNGGPLNPAPGFISITFSGNHHAS
jgi:hypothetical protein